ncbi:MAG: N-acetylgalactosamine 6-sulfate sulfatase (GALNS) [Planctomycetaceae bacterium]|nr:N-acetylgalactosamine 6-sulfate sulfatase (GALNS) [Planctomycetaceae bacterium]
MYYKYFLALIIPQILCFLPISVFAAQKPNVVYIMADELGYFEPSFMGSQTIQTPRIDELARQGVWFTQGLAGSSVCAPTRCCFLTGKHSGHTSVRVNGGGTPLRSEEVTIGTILKKRGYATGGFGKWGCGGRGSTGVPEEHGFDLFVGYYDQVHAHSYYPPYIIQNSQELRLPGNLGADQGETYSHYVIMDRAKQFIREHQAEPFFCYLPIPPPHGMFNIPDNDPAWKKYRDQDWPEPARRYAAMVTMVDRQVGEIVDLLQELELAENTIVFFSGDNGGNDYFKSDEHPRGLHGANVHPETGEQFRGTKGTLYEGGLRIPALAYWPGKIEGGRVSDHLWYFPDILPTIAEITGAKAPKDIDGISFWPELQGKYSHKKQARHEYLYWEIGGQRALRVKQMKAIQPGAQRDWELYDLSDDISEAVNVAEQHVELLDEMKMLADSAHTDAREGTFADRTNHEKDRQAKWGSTRPLSSPQKVSKLDTTGLIAQSQCKIVAFSSQSMAGNRLAQYVLDGNPRTHWHTQYVPEVRKQPHHLVIDLGKLRSVTGIRYLARQDGGYNGAIARFEVYVSQDGMKFETPVATGTFQRNRISQQHTFSEVSARFVKIVALTEVNGGPWASAAEIGVIGK